MKKLISVIFLILVVVAALAGFGWVNKTALLARWLSGQLHVKVALHSFDISPQSAYLIRFRMGTPPKSHTTTSFAADAIDIQANMKKILDDPLIIDSITVSNILVGIEYYKDQSTNWDYILGGASKEAKPSRKYLIRTLTLNNLTVVVTQANGTQKTYPIIDRLVFHDISSESGFPIKEIEKAIFQKVMQDIFEQFNLFKKLPDSPLLKYLPGLRK